MRTIGVWCEHGFQVYSGMSIVEKYLKNSKVILFTKKANVQYVEEIMQHENFSIAVIDNYTNKYASFFKLLFELLFVPKDFSFVYRKEFVDKETGWRKKLRNLFIFKLPKNKINPVYVKLNKLFFNNLSIDRHFKLDLMVTFTKVYYSYLIPDNSKVPHINIMESWDHPMKFPYYVNPNRLLTWNIDLAKETKEVQNLNKISYIYPLKFKYIPKYRDMDEDEILEKLKGTHYYDELVRVRGKNLIMYPATTSSLGIKHEGEMKLLGDLCDIFKNTEYTFYIKPKPNGPEGDYDEFATNDSIMVGMYSSNPNSKDMLDEKYHMFRCLLLKYSKIIINSGTTFAMEAAMMDKPVVQLHLTTKEYLGFDDFCSAYDLEEYVLKLGGIDFGSKYKSSFLDQLHDESHMVFSKKLKHWVTKKSNVVESEMV